MIITLFARRSKLPWMLGGAALALAIGVAADALSARLPVSGQSATEVTAPGPSGPLAGTLVDAGKDAPVVLIVPGSGPTDRDGNNPMGVSAAPYRMLAEALAAKGISSVRADKRGMFGSRPAAANANKARIADYAADVHAWVGVIRARTGARCIWLAGHSEGGLVVLQAAQRGEGICGVITIAAAGRRFSDVVRAQLRANPGNAPILPPAMAAIDSLEAGKHADLTSMPAPLTPLFNEGTQDYLIDLFSHDPAALAASLKLPLLIVQGDRDIQIGAVDAAALKAGAPAASLVTVSGMTHVLKQTDGETPAASLATYSNPNLPISTELVEAVVQFVNQRR